MLPWPEYTHPQGPLNLASHLQKDFDNPPDLGPKSYVAYGRHAPPTHPLALSRNTSEGARCCLASQMGGVRCCEMRGNALMPLRLALLSASHVNQACVPRAISLLDLRCP